MSAVFSNEIALKSKKRNTKNSTLVSKVVEELKTTFRYSRLNCNTASNLVQIPLPAGSDFSSSVRQEKQIVTISILFLDAKEKV